MCSPVREDVRRLGAEIGVPVSGIGVAGGGTLLGVEPGAPAKRLRGEPLMCGVFGIRSEERDVSRLAYFGLFALQHRGQESAGIAVSDHGRLTVVRDMGLVAQVFNEQQLQALPGEVAIGHTRYSTTGANRWANAQPLIHHGRARTVALGHNGNLVNVEELRAELVEDGVRLGSGSDSEVIAALIARDPAPLPEAVASTMRRLEGAYSVTALIDGTLLAFRDPFGFRPLTLGQIGEDWVVASETCALDLIGAEVVRDVRPGEILLVDAEGVHAAQALPAGRNALCIFEHVYFARPDSRVAGIEVHGARVRMGERLAEEAPVEADLVIGIPDSGTPAAIGFSNASGIPFNEGLIKNRYVARTFIQPDQAMREQGIRMKFNPLSEVEGRRIVVVDDSIVRGYDDAPARRDAAGRRRVRDPRADLVAAGRLSVLLRDRHGRRGRARRSASLGRGDANARRRDVAPLPLGRGDAGGDDSSGGRGLPRVFHARLPDPGAAQGREAPLRDRSGLASARGCVTLDRRDHQLEVVSPSGRSLRAALELVPAAVADGSAHGPRVMTPLEQLLPDLTLLRHAQEQPGDRDDRDQRALEHHQRAGEALVGLRREAEVVVARLVDVVEGLGPDEDVSDERANEPDADDVPELGAGAEPFGGGQCLEDREPEDDAGREERDVLDRMDSAGLHRAS